MKKLPASAEPSGKPEAGRDVVSLIELQSLTIRAAREGGRVHKRIEEIRAAMPLELLRCFDQVAEHGRTAVAAVSESGACGSCHLCLPSGLAYLVSRGGQLCRCPHCGCFLYSPAMLPLAADNLKNPRARA